jgi:hypothetical protein
MAKGKTSMEEFLATDETWIERGIQQSKTAPALN